MEHSVQAQHRLDVLLNHLQQSPISSPSLLSCLSSDCAATGNGKLPPIALDTTPAPEEILEIPLRQYLDYLEHPDALKGAKRMNQFMKKHREIFKVDRTWSLKQYRAALHDQFLFIARNELFSVQTMKEKLEYFLGLLEPLLQYDVSLGAKIVIHYQLFGGSIWDLGTERHRKYIPDIDTAKVFGGFLMTEIEHGSNVRSVQTRAVYDEKTDEFVITTPSDGAGKYWIGNMAEFGHIGVLFARLVIRNTDYGVHPFLVSVRDPRTMKVHNGVEIREIGMKVGWNGVDNSYIKFSGLRIPRENLLNKLADVAQGGAYRSDIQSEGRRFAAILSSLVFGRLLYVMGPSRALDMGVLIATRYAFQRKQFGPATGEQLIIDYPSHQRRLFPYVSMAMAFRIMRMKLPDQMKDAWNDEEKMKLFHADISGIKAVVTEAVPPILHKLRVMCGGHGYLAANKLGELRNDLDVFETAEGDSFILLQQMAKHLLTEYKKQFSGKLSGAIQYLSQKFRTYLEQQNPVIARTTSEPHLRDHVFHAHAFEFRSAVLLHHAAITFRNNLKRFKRDPFQAWTHSVNELVAAARAYVHGLVLKAFQEAVMKSPDPKIHKVLKIVCDLYALHSIEQDMGLFRNHEYFKKNKGLAITRQINKLCADMREYALDIVNSFGLDDDLMQVPIATKNRDYIHGMIDATLPSL